MEVHSKRLIPDFALLYGVLKEREDKYKAFICQGNIVAKTLIIGSIVSLGSS